MFSRPNGASAMVIWPARHIRRMTTTHPIARTGPASLLAADCTGPCRRPGATQYGLTMLFRGA